MRKRLQSLALASAAAAVLAGPAAAGVIIQPKSVTVLSGGTAAGYDITNIINQSGLSKTYKSGVTDFDTYLASDPMHAFNAGEWLSEGPASQARIMFDFGESVELTGFAIFNEDATSMTQIALRVGDTPESTVGIGAAFFPTQNPFGVDYRPTSSSRQAVRGQYWVFDVFGCNRPGFNHNGCGIGEVVFNSTTPAPVAGVPEPATWAMMIMGFMGTGAAMRRRNRGLAAA